MEITVSEARGVEVVGGSWEDLHTHLHNTASREYADEVMAWFDNGHTEPLVMLNGSDQEVWHVAV